MTNMIHEIMQEMFYAQKSGGEDAVSIQAIRNIIEKHDAKSFASFEPVA